MEDLINNIVSNRVHTILETIHKSYPDKFKKADIKKEHAILIKHIKLNKTNYNIIKKDEESESEYESLKSSETESESLSETETETESEPIQKPNYKLKNLKPVVFKNTQCGKQYKTINKCNARVWNDYIISVKTGEKVKKVDEQFMVSDYRRLDVDEFLKKYKIGNQCRNKKVGNGKYCPLHTEHLVHGDIDIKPSKQLCYHFIKDSKY